MEKYVDDPARLTLDGIASLHNRHQNPPAPTVSSSSARTAADEGGWWGDFEPRTIAFRMGGMCGIPVKDGISNNYEDLEERASWPFKGVDVLTCPW